MGSICWEFFASRSSFLKTCLIRSATSDLLFVRHFPGVQLWGCLFPGFCETNYHHCQAFMGRHQSGNLECKTNWNPTLDRARHAMSMVPVWADVVCPHPLTCIESEAKGVCVHVRYVRMSHARCLTEHVAVQKSSFSAHKRGCSRLWVVCRAKILFAGKNSN